MENIDLKVAADYGCETGENPLGNPIDGFIYWTDIPGGKLYRFDPKTGNHEQIYAGDPVGGFTIQEDGSLLLFMAKGKIALRRRNGEIKILQPFLPGEEESRFNDVIADPKGRAFCGTMPTPDRPGRLYRLDLDGSISVIQEGLECSNGMGFTLDKKKMYHIDSGKREIYRYDYDEDSGTLKNRQLLKKTPVSEGVPDGMTVDSEGYLWVAHWNGHTVIRYNPEGEDVFRIPIPVKKVSCVTFSPPDYRTLFITTAGGSNKEEEGELAGALLYCSPGNTGRKEYFSRIKIS